MFTNKKNSPIQDVSDTALWVATYRALETERPDALFHDPFAARLTGDRGRLIAQSMKRSKYTSWHVTIRTRIIDDFIHDLVNSGAVDTVVNLGAGLDARPYRMNLPSTLKWIEVDYPHMIERKSELLANEAPRCHLQRIKLDLADQVARQKLFADIQSQTQNALILTEGVVPYLTEEQTASLAEDLHAHSHFRFWLVEYISTHLYKYFQSRERKSQMKNAPFQFFPAHWHGFFRQHGWQEKESKYIYIESARLGRKSPAPLIMKLMRFLMPAKKRLEMDQLTGYILLESV